MPIFAWCFTTFTRRNGAILSFLWIKQHPYIGIDLTNLEPYFLGDDKWKADRLNLFINPLLAPWDPDHIMLPRTILHKVIFIVLLTSCYIYANFSISAEFWRKLKCIFPGKLYGAPLPLSPNRKWYLFYRLLYMLNLIYKHNCFYTAANAAD